MKINEIILATVEKVSSHIKTVKDYMTSKCSNSNTDAEKQTLFKDMNSPSIDRAGYLMSLSCGHNGRPNELETAILISHLEAANFIRKPPKKLNEDDYESA